MIDYYKKVYTFWDILKIKLFGIRCPYCGKRIRDYTIRTFIRTDGQSRVYMSESLIMICKYCNKLSILLKGD